MCLALCRESEMHIRLLLDSLDICLISFLLSLMNVQAPTLKPLLPLRCFTWTCSPGKAMHLTFRSTSTSTDTTNAARSKLCALLLLHRVAT